MNRLAENAPTVQLVTRNLPRSQDQSWPLPPFHSSDHFTSDLVPNQITSKMVPPRVLFHYTHAQTWLYTVASLYTRTVDMDHPENEVQALLESSLGEDEFHEVTLPMGQTLWDNDAVQLTRDDDCGCSFS